MARGCRRRVDVCMCGRRRRQGTIIAACTKDGESQKNCECVATELEKALDKDAFHAMALGAQGKEEEAEKIVKALPMDKQMAMATSAMGAMMKCAPGLANFMAALRARNARKVVAPGAPGCSGRCVVPVHARASAQVRARRSRSRTTPPFPTGWNASGTVECPVCALRTALCAQ